MTIEEAIEKAAKELPEGWEIRIVVKKGSKENLVEAYDPTGEFYNAGYTHDGIAEDILNNVDWANFEDNRNQRKQHTP